MVIHQRDIPSGHHAEANMPAAAAGDATFVRECLNWNWISFTQLPDQDLF